MRRAYAAIRCFGDVQSPRVTVMGRTLSSLGLEKILAAARIEVFASADLEHRATETGVLLGHAIRGSETGSPPLAEAIKSGVAHAFWGDFVALEVASGEQMVVERSPSGRLEALHLAIDGHEVVASHAEILLALLARPPQIDWDFVRYHLAFPHLRTARTGLAGMASIMPGERVRVGEGLERETIWSPWMFADRDPALSDDRLGGLIRSAVVRSVHDLTAHARSPILELSGGLDSSILSVACGTCGIGASAVNLVTPTQEGDERIYARAAATKAGLPLVELPLSDLPDLTAPTLLLSPYPTLPASLVPADRLLADLISRHQVDAFISGHGGDSVFGYPGSTGPAADALRVFGPGRCFAESVHGVAEIWGTTFWRAGRMAIAQAVRAPLNKRWPRSTDFLQKDRLPTHPEFHPWLDEPDDALPGKRSHIRSIVGAFAHLDGFERHERAPIIFPLLSQPVMEACLRVPTWLQVAGGRDRALARAAFADQLPNIVVERRGKGRLDGYLTAAFEANWEKLPAFLLDGALASAGLLDQLQLERLLQLPPREAAGSMFRLLPIIDTERWLRSWAPRCAR